MPDGTRAPQAPFVPIIPAGGAGTRLWPLSRRARPKFLLDLTGSGRSLLQQTLDRLAPVQDRPAVIVTGRAHEDAVHAQMGGTARVLVEPTPRSSMPAIAIAAALVEREDPGAVVGSFAADHVVTGDAAFRDAVTAARTAAEAGYLVTIGIRPTGPATQFGYIERSSADPAGDLVGTGAVPVARFVEKPDRERAEAFLASGRFLWNAGMFVARASMLLDALAEQIPPLAAGAREIARAHATPAEPEVLERVWPQLTSIAIDHALAEPLAAAGRVAVVPADLGWEDVGDYSSLARVLRAARGDAPAAGPDVLVHGEVETIAVDARATVYGSSDRPVALVGLRDVSVVLGPDAVLVIADEHAQRLGELGSELERRGHGHLR